MTRLRVHRVFRRCRAAAEVRDDAPRRCTSDAIDGSFAATLNTSEGQVFTPKTVDSSSVVGASWDRLSRLCGIGPDEDGRAQDAVLSSVSRLCGKSSNTNSGVPLLPTAEIQSPLSSFRLDIRATRLVSESGRISVSPAVRNRGERAPVIYRRPVGYISDKFTFPSAFISH